MGTRNNNMAQIGFIMSLFGLFIPALICSICGLVDAGKVENGRGYAIAGILLSVIWFIIEIVLVLFLVQIIMQYIADFELMQQLVSQGAEAF